MGWNGADDGVRSEGVRGAGNFYRRIRFEVADRFNRAVSEASRRADPSADSGADSRAAPPPDDDPGYRVIKGRRWRISDPALDETLRQALVDELMSARRAVGAARRANDAVAERAARCRVGDAKVALGERGPRWWEARGEEEHRLRAAAAVRTLLRGRADGADVGAGEVARVVDNAHWRKRLVLVREELRRLCRDGELVERGGRTFRAGRGPRFPSPPVR